MLREFFITNSVGVCLLGLSVAGLIIRKLFNSVEYKGRYILIGHVISFLLWSCIVIILCDIASSLINDLDIRYLTPANIMFFGISVIVLMCIRKIYLAIDYFEQKQIIKGRDITDSKVISKILKIVVSTIVVLMYGEHFGMSLSGLLAFGGIGGIALGMASKDVLSNFFSGVILYFDRPFSIGDWIRSPDRNIEGTVTEIGWRATKINTFDHRPLYVPNSLFSSISVENPGRMINRRIKATVGLRYEDAKKLNDIVDSIRDMLRSHPDIEDKQTLLVYFNEFSDSSLNIMVYCFTKTKEWEEWLRIQQDVYLKIIGIVHKFNADFAYPSQTIYVNN